MKTLYKVKIYKNNKFISYGEFVKEYRSGFGFSLASNIRCFDGHKNRNLKNYKYIWGFTAIENIEGKSFNEIIEYLKKTSSHNDFCEFKFVLLNSNNFDCFDCFNEIKL